MYAITGHSGVYGVFGDPVKHSLSPLMHNAAFNHVAIDAIYVPFHVPSGSLATAVSAIRSLGIKGINVTIPHKEAIIPFLDEVDQTAQRVGAVNTVVNSNGRLVGYNTDSSGFLRSACSDLGFKPPGSQVVLLGAGGACRAAVQALLSAGVKQITIVNRTVSRAIDLIASFKTDSTRQQLTAVTYQSATLLQALANADLLVNTTSIGLQGEMLDLFPLENIKGSALIYDMVYSGVGTALVQAAGQRGLTCIDGLSLLAAQGEDAFFIWTGVRLPDGFMHQQLLKYLHQMGKE